MPPILPYDATLLALNNAANAGAFGFGSQARPTAAQQAAGNYAKGRADWQGLRLVVEQPRGTYREGKGWRNLMAAHYGYIAGTLGNDGDELDCFIGSFVDSQRVWVVNQHLGGQFDEHKAMLAFDSEDAARSAYLRSYDRGWTGLGSIVALSVPQFKWWLQHGDKTRPLTTDNLPYEGTEPMKRTYWDDNAEPIGQNLDALIYGIRQHDGGAGLLLDSVTVADIHADPDNQAVLVMDAMVTPFQKLDPKMNVLRAVMERTGTEVKPVAVQISEPFKQRGTVNVAAVFELSDGQTITVYFHNPDSTPAKLAPGDQLVSWKWLLNKKDCTIVVAPERGADLNIREVARRLMKLAEKNSAAFQRANAKRAERLGNIAALQDEVAQLETTLENKRTRLEVVKLQAADASKAREEAAAAAAAADAAYLPDGWTESKPGGMATKAGKDGGIIDTNAVSGKWFVIFNDDRIENTDAIFDTRREAFEKFAERTAELAAQTAAAQPTFAVGDYLTANFPRLNKRQTLADYKSTPSGSQWLCQVQKVLALTPEAYDEVANNLLASNSDLGAGGSASDSPLITADLFKRSLSDWTPEQQAEWERTSYNLVTVVQAPGRETFVIDAQGYGYARYVGLDPKPAAAPVLSAAPTPPAPPEPTAPAADVLAVSAAMAKTLTNPVWFNDKAIYGPINAGVQAGWLVRRSTTQVGWTEAGVAASAAAKASAPVPTPAAGGTDTGIVDGDGQAVATDAAVKAAAIAKVLVDRYGFKKMDSDTTFTLRLAAPRSGKFVDVGVDSGRPNDLEIDPEFSTEISASYSEPAEVIAEAIDTADFAELYGDFDTQGNLNPVIANGSVFDGKPIAFAKAAMMVEEGAKRVGTSVHYGDFNGSTTQGLALDAATGDVTVIGITAQIHSTGQVWARADISEAGAVRLLKGAAGEEAAGPAGTAQEVADTISALIDAWGKAQAAGTTTSTKEEPVQPTPVTNPDAATLRAIIDGTTDPLTADLSELEAIYERNQDDAEIQALFEQAVNIVVAAEDQATTTV